MLLPLRLNLDRVAPAPVRDGGGGTAKRFAVARKNPRNQQIEEAANQIDALLNGVTTKTDLRKVTKAVRAYSEDDSLRVSQVSEMLAALSSAEYELRQQAKNQEQNIKVLLILEQISVLLSFVQDDEETILVLLLSGV